jgi:hypothetical protein
MRRAMHVARMGKVNTYRILESKPEVKRQFGRLRLIWEDNIEIYHKDMGERACNGLIWQAVVKKVMNIRVP